MVRSSTTRASYPPPLYDAVHGGRTEDLRFYRAAVRGAHRVLELGCGHGRIAKLADEEGAEIVGIDLSARALDVARRLIPRGTFVQGDMRDFQLPPEVPSGFDRVLIPYNGLYCLLDEDAQRQVLERARQHLVPGGLLVFDGYSADGFHADGEEGPAETAFVSRVSAEGVNWDVYGTSNWQKSGQRIDAHYDHRPEGGGESVAASIPQRYLLRAQIEPLVESAGLEVLVVHGDFDQSVWDEDAPYLIVTAQRPSIEA